MVCEGKTNDLGRPGIKPWNFRYLFHKSQSWNHLLFSNYNKNFKKVQTFPKKFSRRDLQKKEFLYNIVVMEVFLPAWPIFNLLKDWNLFQFIDCFTKFLHFNPVSYEKIQGYFGFVAALRGSFVVWFSENHKSHSEFRGSWGHGTFPPWWNHHHFRHWLDEKRTHFGMEPQWKTRRKNHYRLP